MPSFLATAYGPPWDAMEGSGVTSTGVNLRAGQQIPIIAVDPGVIPYGSIVRVSNSPLGPNHLFVAGDTGGAIRGNHIDFFVASGRSAQNGWGAQHINLQVVKQGSGPGSVNAALQQVMKGQVSGGAQPTSAGQGATSTGQPTVSTSFSGGQTDYNAAGLSALMAGADKPIKTTGNATFKADNTLGRLLSNVESGQFTTPSQANTHITPAAQTASSSGGAPLLPGGQGDINPLQHFTYGRTDQGVDANAAPGTPIRAINTSVVKEILPNWYAGQPLILMQLTSGPNKGKYWYVAEQISHGLHVGQVIQRGGVVATYASHGTGLEIGWGSPNSNSRTLAGATTGYSEGQVTPAGSDFRHRELHA